MSPREPGETPAQDAWTSFRHPQDFSSVRGFKPLLRLARSRNDTRAAMEKTLENIEKVLASS
jgi:hypothetical protein